jgi:glycosyltransferase involved in cell wall biosynthesis
VKYILITSARNEEAFIAGTLDSVAAQTQLPERWVIIDDGSSDRTAEIIADYAKKFPWISLIRNPKREGRNFAAKANAVNTALAQSQDVEFDIIGNLDADISFGPDHFEFLLQKFAGNPALGVAGTAYAEAGWDSMKDSFEGSTSVHGACQFFRKECFREIGGYVPNAAGGVDWIAVTTARLKGWQTQNFPERRFHHHRRMGTAERGQCGALFDYGMKDYYLGGSPLWELFRVAYRLGKKPYLGGGFALGSGYFWAALRRTKRSVSPELMRFHRREQRQKLKTILGALIRFNPVEKFYPASGPVEKTNAGSAKSITITPIKTKITRS